MQRCPLCKVNVMYLGGMAAKDGAICARCYSKLLEEKKLQDGYYKKLYISELDFLLSTSGSSTDINKAAQTLLEKRQNLTVRFSPVSQSFRSSYAGLFSSSGIPQNAEIQKSVTQFLWHKLVLKKNRLDKKGIKLQSEIEQSVFPGREALIGMENFDGKYETGTFRETVKGAERYYKEEKLLHEAKNFSIFRFRTLNAHQAKKGKFICPSCGAPSSRSDLLDGCDYCGIQFLVEDLSMRISDFALENDYSIDAGVYFKKSASSAGKKVGIVAFVLMLPVCFMNIAQFFVMLLGCALFASLLGLVASFMHEIIIKPLKWFFMDSKGVKQLYKRNAAESARNNEKMLKKIQEFDPLFSYEGFYGEVENILSVMHYAGGTKQVQAFWNGTDEKQILPFTAERKNLKFCL